MNPFTDALNGLTDALQEVIGAEVLVTREPGEITANVASAGLAVLVNPGMAQERSSYRTWFLDVPVSICFPAPGEPRHVDPAYGVAHQIMAGGFESVGMDARPLQLDAATVLPAITVTLRITTEC